MISWRIISLAKTLLPTAFFIFLPISFANADAAPAQANVYDINPLRTPQPVVHTLVNLQDPLYLSGSYVNIIDTKYCNNCGHSLAERDPNAGFIYNPGDPRLAEAMAYHQIDQYRNYIVNSVGISLPALPITIDAHKVDANGNDITGASYTPPPIFGGTWPGTIAVGDKNRIDTNGDWIADTDVPNIEMALNADVLVHEYGHAVTDYLRSGSYSALPKFMQEGWADYLMCSKLGSPLIGDWTDRNGFRGYRRSLIAGISQLDLWPTTNIRQADGISNTDYNTARIYYNSMAWSGPLWELRERITRLAGYDYTVGSVLTDRLVLTAIPLFQVSGQSDSNPMAAITEGVRSLKQALAQLRLLYPDYQNVTDTDIDLAFSARFPKEYLISQNISVNEREKAWLHQVGRKDISIAVIDSGLAQYMIAAFASEDKNLNGVLDAGEDANGNAILDRGNIALGWDFLNGDPSPVDGLSFAGSHGTSVALYLAAVANNAEESVGMIWNTSLWILKKSDSVEIVPWSAVNQHTGEAFRYAAVNKADMVNLSSGVFSDTGALDNPSDAFHMPTFNAIQEGIRQHQEKDTLVIVAAGNLGWNIDTTPIYPASYPLPNIISVTTKQPLNYGKYNVDLAAGGSATSFATPLVSGAVGLLLSEQKDRQEAQPGYRSLTVGEIKYLLLMSTDHVQALEGKAVSEGQLNARRLLEYYESDADWDGYCDKIEELFGTNTNDLNSHPDLVDGDNDGDGLSDHLELAYGTIPIPVSPGVNYSGKLYPVYLDANGAIKTGISAQDSDDDGIGDLAETRASSGYYTDPANPDTDGDSISDGQDASPSLFKVAVNNSLALNKPTTASDVFISLWGPANATDGNAGSWWQTTNSGGPHWLTVDLGVEARVHETRFLFDTQYSAASDYTLQFSINGDFSDPATREVRVTGNSQRDRTDAFAAPIRARYVRFLITEPSAAGNFFRVKEFEVHGVMPTNIAIAKTATASDDFYGFWTAKYAVDGVSGSHWQTAAGVASPHWLQVDLGAPSSVSSIVTHYDTQYNFASDYTLQFSNTGDFSATGLNAPYEVHVTNNISRDPADSFYNPVKARYVRLLINQPSSGFFRVKELEIVGVTP